MKVYLVFYEPNWESSGVFLGAFATVEAATEAVAREPYYTAMDCLIEEYEVQE